MSETAPPALPPSPSTPTDPTPAFTPVRWESDAIVVIDQRRLPTELVELRLTTVAQVVDAIGSLAVRGAPVIGIVAAYALALGLRSVNPASVEEAASELARLEEVIGGARPTAVNLRGALADVRSAALASGAASVDEFRASVLRAAIALHAADHAASAAIGRNGRQLLGDRRRILTHCNTGRLATTGDGTALAVVYALAAAGSAPEVLATESRPLLQGARLTAWELQAAGVDVRLIVDAAAGAAMAAGLVDAVIVGCDRVAANGDTANKIGTYQLAIVARHHGIPFYVAGPLSSFDPATRDGASIVIEQRPADEVRRIGSTATAPPDIDAWNPAFDVTPAELIDAFITEAGILRPPYAAAIASALGSDDGNPSASTNGLSR